MAAYVPSDELRAAWEAERAAKAAYDTALEHLYDAIATEVAKPNRPADVGRFVGYHSGHVRRIARDRGVAPLVDVEPPKRLRIKIQPGIPTDITPPSDSH